MTAFRVLLVAMWAAIFGYTAIVVANHGRCGARARASSFRPLGSRRSCPTL